MMRRDADRAMDSEAFAAVERVLRNGRRASSWLLTESETERSVHSRGGTRLEGAASPAAELELKHRSAVTGASVALTPVGPVHVQREPRL
jgi:hypothetical protein